jgi:putative transposase
MLKKRKNTPAHLLLDDTPYFITAIIYQSRRLLAEPQLKETLLELIQTYFAKYNWELHHWVILDNHYHILGQSRRGEDLSNVMRSIHSHSAQYIRSATQAAKPIWWNYWDYCPRNEADYLTRLNYLLYNPIKHGYTTDLKNYPFSSFHQLYETKGRTELVHQFQMYPAYRTLVLSEVDDEIPQFQSRESQSKESQSRESQSRESQKRESQSRESQSRESQS